MTDWTKERDRLAAKYVRHREGSRINTLAENWTLGGAFLAGWDARDAEVKARCESGTCYTLAAMRDALIKSQTRAASLETELARALKALSSTV